MKRWFWSAIFIIGLPLTFSLSFYLYTLLPSNQLFYSPPPQVLSSSTDNLSPNSFGPAISNVVLFSDARPILVRNYLKQYSSPLETYTTDIISISDKYSLDFRLLVAIARQESNLCKRIPDNSYNCWGFGIYGDKVTRFNDYHEALETVAKTLKTQYIDKGLDTPEKIMAKYTPPSVLIGGPWAKGVNQFMSEME